MEENDLNIVVLSVVVIVIALCMAIPSYFSGYDKGKKETALQYQKDIENAKVEANNQVEQYREEAKEARRELNQVKNSKQYKAIIKCEDSGAWVVECLGFELTGR